MASRRRCLACAQDMGDKNANPYPRATANEILQLLAEGKCFKEIAEHFGYKNFRHVCRILRHHRRKHGLRSNFQALAEWVRRGEFVVKRR